MNNINETVGYDLIKKNGGVGFAKVYLYRCYNKTSLINEADVGLYQELVQLDSRFGTTQTEQLWGCVQYALKIDLIQVLIIY